jgi:hypothetical protein
MPMSVIFTGDGGIMATGDGVVTGAEIIEVNDAIYESPEKTRKIVYQICDFTNISGASISNFEIEQLAIQDKKASEINPNMFFAIVAREDYSYGLARMWEAFSHDSPFETMIFRNVDDARQWIEEKLKKKP